MSKNARVSVLGAAILTPALVGPISSSHASTPRTNVTATPSLEAAQTRLKAGLLTLSLSEKLTIAGDRVPLQSAAGTASGHALMLAGSSHTSAPNSSHPTAPNSGHTTAPAMAAPAPPSNVDQSNQNTPPPLSPLKGKAITHGTQHAVHASTWGRAKP